jgi:hypothetical protein
LFPHWALTIFKNSFKQGTQVQAQTPGRGLGAQRNFPEHTINPEIKRSQIGQAS